MNKKLLYKTSRAYLVFSILILLAAVPLFFLLIRKLYLDEADETLLLFKKEFIKYSEPALADSSVITWNAFNRNVKILPRGSLTKDSISTTFYYDTLDLESEPYRQLVSPVEIKGKPYKLLARINLVESEDLLLSLGLLFFILGAILLAGMFFINRKLSLSVWKPFYELLGQIENFEIDKNESLRFSKSGVEEFDRLQTSIRKLIEKNTMIFRSQREFVENAAHELQTPLAVFQAKIDTLIQRPDVTQEQAGILGSLNDNVGRLNRLNKNLLLLSKIENANYSDKQKISLTACITKNLDFFMEQAKSKDLSIRLELEEEMDIHSNPSLAEIFISNLFLNAIRHNNPGGEIVIRTIKKVLIFSNTGRGQPLDSAKLFNRFYKINPSEQGAGLGLSIVKKIADLNGWGVRYVFDGNCHSFHISFPQTA